MSTVRANRPTWRAALTDRRFVVHYLQMLAAMLAGMIVFGPLLILLVIFFPQGLIGLYREWQARRAAAASPRQREGAPVLESQDGARANA